MFIIAKTFWACSSEDYYKDSGTANRYHDCTVMEYLESNTKNFSLVVEAIKRAGIENVFNGKLYPEITFFGITDLSVYQFLYKTVDSNSDPLYERIADVPVDMLKAMILSHVITDKMMMEDFDYEVVGTLEGGTIKKTLTDGELRIYRRKSDYLGLPDKGPESLYIHALTSGHVARIASCNIEMNNGVVHSLDYTYEWTELK